MCQRGSIGAEPISQVIEPCAIETGGSISRQHDATRV
jgi:hypothetical protein